MICPATASKVLAWAAAGIVYSSLQTEGWLDETHPGSFYSLSRSNLVFRNLYTLSAGLHSATAFYASFSSPLLLSAFFFLSLLSLALPSSSLSLLSLFFLPLLLSLSFFLNSLSQRFPFLSLFPPHPLFLSLSSFLPSFLQQTSKTLLSSQPPHLNLLLHLSLPSLSLLTLPHLTLCY